MSGVDLQLIIEAQRGDVAAFEAIFRANYGWMLRLCRSYATCEADAHDLAQDAFVKAHRALPRLADPAAMKGWLAMIGRNVGRDAVAKRQRQHALAVAEKQRIEVSQPSSRMSLEAQALRGEARGLAAQIIQAMPNGRPKQTADLFYLQDCEVNEIATRLKVSVTNVTSSLSRARVWLRKNLLGRLEELRGYR